MNCSKSSFLTRLNGICYDIRALEIYELIEKRVENEHFNSSINRKIFITEFIKKLREENSGESYHEAKELWKLYCKRHPNDVKNFDDPTLPRWGWPDFLGPISH